MTVKRATLADVARRAGTSTAVVSYVLNDGPRPVSESTRARVVAALDALNYRPDRAARALRRPRRWRHLGLLVPDVRMPLFATLVGHIEAEARRRDHLTLIGNTGYDPEREIEFASAFTDSGIEGLIVVGGANGRATAELCRHARIPIVWVHNNRDEVEPDVVGADHIRAGASATRHLTDTHRRGDVVFVGGFTAGEVAHGDRETVAQRYEGYRSVVGSERARRIATDLTPAGAYHAVGRYLAGNPAPDGLVVGTYAQAAATLRAVADAGLLVPRDLSVVGYDTDTSDTYAAVTLTAVRQPIDVIARLALSRVLDSDETSDQTQPPGPPEPIVTHLAIGETCGCATR
ncbi:LacI family DNA-binding transcriptional regulator [Nocardia sp. BSTN01]|uniref:LacI family DNA-binding transcriptional regulator n=1 Tax=Nocardia sp. BSTN01 TaxID=2783665 RepID=UPI002814D6CA|nr:LacI family DNA-binding transcriptional regulator [Nocardia sp. BSTN01]